MGNLYIRARQLARKLPHPVRFQLLRFYRKARRTASEAKRTKAGQAMLEKYRDLTSPHQAGTWAEVNQKLPLALDPATQWFRYPLTPYKRYRLRLETVETLDPAGQAGAVQYRFLDARGRQVKTAAVHKPDSPDLGYFDFIPRVPEGNRSDYVFFSPGDADFVDIGFRTWKPDADITLGAAEVQEIGDRTAVRAYDLAKGIQPRTPLRVAVIADTFTKLALSYECDILALTQKNYQAELDEFAPDLVFIESAWDGNDSEWLYCVYSIKPEDTRLRGAVDAARSRDVPVLFWNKEDPAHFADFLEAARLCDFVATTDATMIPCYQQQLGHDRVFALPFCIQPDIHNPRRPHDARGPRIDAACFLGSWWAEKFDERRESQVALLEGSRDFGLEVYDRYFTFNAHERYRMPPPWLDYVHGTLEYPQALSAYRMYRVILNVNTITDSPTMFSRRALEAAACGAGVITNPSAGTDEAFGDLIHSAATADECAAALDTYRADPRRTDQRLHLAYRRMHREHSWENRLDDIAEHCGISIRRARKPSISVVLATMRPDGAERILQWLGSLDQSDYELTAQVVTAFDPESLAAATADHFPAAVFHQQEPDETLGDCLNWGADNSSADYIAKIDDDDLYGPNYFDDLLLAARFSRADVIGKQCHFEWFESRAATMLRYPGSEHRFTDFVCGSTLLMRSEVFESVRFPKRRVGEDTVFLNRVQALGLKTYSADRFNYVSMRRADLSSHTWQATDDELIDGNETEFYTADIAEEELNL